jgi:hypothetical protein
MSPDPDDPTKVIYKDPHTGKKTKKNKPDGFDEYWKKKHPGQQNKNADKKQDTKQEDTTESQSSILGSIANWFQERWGELSRWHPPKPNNGSSSGPIPIFSPAPFVVP